MTPPSARMLAQSYERAAIDTLCLLLLFVRALYRMPFVGRRLRPGGLAELEAGNQAVELQQ